MNLLESTVDFYQLKVVSPGFMNLLPRTVGFCQLKTGSAQVKS
jgi:hypothetical protein